MARFLRGVFLLLILANLAFFAWSEGYFGPADDGREPQRLSGQLAAEKLHVVAPLLPAVEPVDASTPQTAAPIAPAAPVEIPSVVEACRAISGLKLVEAQQLQAQAAERAAGIRILVKPLDAPPPGYWVFIPPLASKAAAGKKIAELKQMGVSDLFLMPDDGPERLAISLGMFSSEHAASDYLRTLAKRGIRSARVQVRSKPAEKARVEVRGPQDVLLKALSGLVIGAAGASVGECAEDR